MYCIKKPDWRFSSSGIARRVITIPVTAKRQIIKLGGRRFSRSPRSAHVWRAALLSASAIAVGTVGRRRHWVIILFGRWRLWWFWWWWVVSQPLAAHHKQVGRACCCLGAFFVFVVWKFFLIFIFIFHKLWWNEEMIEKKNIFRAIWFEENSDLVKCRL